ncbi:hypothetical protein LINPERHAP2_LOCUS17558 [Linum perenne]
MNLGICSITRAEIRGALEEIHQAWRAGYHKVEIQLWMWLSLQIRVLRFPTSMLWK